MASLAGVMAGQDSGWMRMTESRSSTALRTHLCGDLRSEHIGQTVSVCGWVARRREHGEHLAFIDLRDHSGIVQCVVNDDVDVRSEYVVRITGTVRARPEGTINENLPTGEVEIGDCAVETLRMAEPPPFPIDSRADDVDEHPGRVVADPSVESESRGEAVDEGAESDALHDAGDPHPNRARRTGHHDSIPHRWPA